MTETEVKKYIFEVAKNTSRIRIAGAIEKVFDVKVIKANILNMRGKEKRIGRFPAGRHPS